MRPFNLRQKPRISYLELDDPDLDEYEFCDECGDYVYEYCAIHGPLLVVPDDKIYNSHRRPSHVVDAAAPDRSNWMRYVNCSRHWREQNLVAYQYQGELYYRTIRIIPRFTELMVFYGSEFANSLGVNLKKYNSPTGYAEIIDDPLLKKPKLDHDEPTNENTEKQDCQLNSSNEAISGEDKGHQAFVGPQRNKVTNNDISENNKRKNPIDKTTNDNNRNSLLLCDGCEYKTVKKRKLIAHMTLHNGNQADFDQYNRLCDSKNIKTKTVHNEKCNQDIAQLTDVDTHMKVQTRERPYRCTVCDKSFTKSSNLQSHIRIHTGEKPYTCTVCNKSFTQTGHLQTHIRIHTGEKPYTCTVCNKSFTHSSDLQKHMRIHTGEKPYTCTVCNKSFNQATHLQTHIRIHTGEKPYTCTVCNKSFNQASNLLKHMRIHTGEKPYLCKH